MDQVARQKVSIESLQVNQRKFPWHQFLLHWVDFIKALLFHVNRPMKRRYKGCDVTEKNKMQKNKNFRLSDFFFFLRQSKKKNGQTSIKQQLRKD